MRCERPFSVQNGRTDLLVAVRCGRCIGCRIWKQKAWTLRMLLEQQSSVHSCFTTLTYAEGRVPERLDYNDVILFLKRCRKNYQGTVRFFCCGEYGKRLSRPHWHIVFFLGGGLISHSTQWRHGFVHNGDATPQSMAYVAKYALKLEGRQEFTPVVRMSRRPGIGLVRARSLGEWLYREHQTAEVLPSWLKVGGRWYPMDRSVREAFAAGFREKGGVLERSPSLLRADLEARMYDRVGGLLEDGYQSLRLCRARVRELERGAL